MRPEILRLVARELAKGLREPMAGRNIPDGPRSLADVLVIGAMIVQAMTPYTAGSVPEPLKKQMAAVIRLFEIGQYPQEVLEEFLFQRIAAGDLRPDEFRQAITFVQSLLNSSTLCRQVVLGAFEEMLPPGEPGQTARLPQEAVASLVDLAQHMLPHAQILLKGQALYPNKTTAEILELIGDEHPTTTAELLQFLSTVEAAQQSREYLEFKTDEPRAVFVADAIAGAALALWKPTYAHQRAEQGRRSRNHQE